MVDEFPITSGKYLLSRRIFFCFILKHFSADLPIEIGCKQLVFGHGSLWNQDRSAVSKCLRILKKVTPCLKISKILFDQWMIASMPFSVTANFEMCNLPAITREIFDYLYISVDSCRCRWYYAVGFVTLYTSCSLPQASTKFHIATYLITVDGCLELHFKILAEECVFVKLSSCPHLWCVASPRACILHVAILSDTLHSEVGWRMIPGWQVSVALAGVTIFRDWLRVLNYYIQKAIIGSYFHDMSIFKTKTS